MQRNLRSSTGVKPHEGQREANMSAKITMESQNSKIDKLLEKMNCIDIIQNDILTLKGSVKKVETAIEDIKTIRDALTEVTKSVEFANGTASEANQTSPVNVKRIEDMDRDMEQLRQENTRLRNEH